MSAQTPTPTDPQAGQPEGQAQGQPVPAQPAVDPVEEQFRKFQSRADGYTQSIEARLKKLQEALATPQNQQPAQANPVMGGPNPTPNAETQWARNAEATFGVSLEPNDIEAALLIDGQTPTEYKRAYLQALAAKKARTSQAAQAQAAPAAPAVVPTTAGGTGQATNLAQEYQQKLADLRKNHRGDIRLLHNLQLEYRKKGVPI